MPKARKTRTERESERATAERLAWKEFVPRLAALQTYAEARTLVAQAPPEDSPGRQYYSNLGFFLGEFAVPIGSNQTERLLYMPFIERLDRAGALSPNAAPALLATLRRSLTDHP